MQKVRRQREAVEVVNRAGGQVHYPPGKSSPETVIAVRLASHELGDDDVACLAELPTLMLLFIDDSQITDDGIRHLEGLVNLKVLSLTNAHITDAGLEAFREMTALEALFLDGTNVTDTGLEHLRGLTNLESLLGQINIFSASQLRFGTQKEDRKSD